MAGRIPKGWALVPTLRGPPTAGEIPATLQRAIQIKDPQRGVFPQRANQIPPAVFGARTLLLRGPFPEVVTDLPPGSRSPLRPRVCGGRTVPRKPLPVRPGRAPECFPATPPDPCPTLTGRGPGTTRAPGPPRTPHGTVRGPSCCLTTPTSDLRRELGGQDPNMPRQPHSQPPAPPGCVWIRDAPELIGLTVGTLRRWRLLGKGPVSFTVGSRIAYRRADLEAYVEGQYQAAAHPVALPEMRPPEPRLGKRGR